MESFSPINTIFAILFLFTILWVTQLRPTPMIKEKQTHARNPLILQLSDEISGRNTFINPKPQITSENQLINYSRTREDERKKLLYDRQTEVPTTILELPPNILMSIFKFLRIPEVNGICFKFKYVLEENLKYAGIDLQKIHLAIDDERRWLLMKLSIDYLLTQKYLDIPRESLRFSDCSGDIPIFATLSRDRNVTWSGAGNHKFFTELKNVKLLRTIGIFNYIGIYGEDRRIFMGIHEQLCRRGKKERNLWPLDSGICMNHVSSFVSNGKAIIFLKVDGSLDSWGDISDGGQIPEVVHSEIEKRNGVKFIIPRAFGFAILFNDHSVISWNKKKIDFVLENVKQIASDNEGPEFYILLDNDSEDFRLFYAIHGQEYVILSKEILQKILSDGRYGNIQDEATLSSIKVEQILSIDIGYAAMLNNRQVLLWDGLGLHSGGQIKSIEKEFLNEGVDCIAATQSVFAASKKGRRNGIIFWRRDGIEKEIPEEFQKQLTENFVDFIIQTGQYQFTIFFQDPDLLPCTVNPLTWRDKIFV